MKKLLFYTVGEYIGVSDFCKRKGLKALKTITKSLDGFPFEVAVQYSSGKYAYEVLDCSECYSGFMTTLMRLPKLTYEQLLEVALTSKSFDEKAGAVGIILKDHSGEFKYFLSSFVENLGADTSDTARVKEVAVLITEFIKERNDRVCKMVDILLLCNNISKM